MKLYHATYEDLIPSIERFGLGGSSSGYEWEDSKKGVVYLATDPEIAISYAETNEEVPEEWIDNIVVFEVRSNYLDQDKLMIDNNVQDNDGSTYEYHGVIPWRFLTLVDEIDESSIKRNVVSEAELVCEMSNKNKAKTHLPMNIWIDESQTYLKDGHSKRVKFQLNHANRMNLNEFGTMDLDGNLHPSDIDIGELSNSDIEQLRNFVLNNKYMLERVADADLWLDDIWPFVILGGEPASYEEITKLNLKVDELTELN